MMLISIITAGLLGVWFASVMTEATEDCRKSK